MLPILDDNSCHKFKRHPKWESVGVRRHQFVVMITDVAASESWACEDRYTTLCFPGFVISMTVAVNAQISAAFSEIAKVCCFHRACHHWQI